MITSKNKKAFLFIIAFTAALGGFLFGFDTAVISGTISFVREKYALDNFMEGWYVSSALIGCIIGVAFAGEFSDRFGRKKTLILSGLLFCISAIGCANSNTFIQVIIFRLLGGIGIGIASMLSPLYISEIAPAKNRGKLVALYQFAITIGILFAYFSNAYLLCLSTSNGLDIPFFSYYILHEEVWRGMLGSAAVPAFLFFFAMFFVPESPRWLITKGKSVEAGIILSKINSEVFAQEELKSILSVNAKAEKGGWPVLFHKKTAVLLFAGIGLAVLSQFTGINAIIYYGPRILEHAGLKLGDALGGQVIIGIVNVVATVFAIWKIDQYGRKKLMMGGITGMCISLITIGALFLTGNTQSVLLLIFIIAFIASFAIGYGPVLWVLLSEIYPSNVRGRAMSVCTMFVWVGTAIVGQVVPWMLDTLTPAVTFFIFALCCIPVPFVLSLIHETKGLSLEEIELSSGN